MNRLVGYEVRGEWGGSRGTAYTYELAGNGLFIKAENVYLRARIPVAPGKVRGLTDSTVFVQLRWGRIPRHLFDLALSVMLNRREKEVYVAIIREYDRYRLCIPGQEGSGAKVVYQNPENVVMDLHSHGKMGPRFSGQDDRDEQGFRLYGCVGRLDRWEPLVNFRVGVYGYWMPVKFEDVFDVPPAGVVDVVASNIEPLGKPFDGAQGEREGEDDAVSADGG